MDFLSLHLSVTTISCIFANQGNDSDLFIFAPILNAKNLATWESYPKEEVL